MNESENAFQIDDVWKFVNANPKFLGIPISNTKHLDLLSALRDIYILSTEEVIGKMLTMLAAVIVAAAHGFGDKVVDEVIVREAMETFDTFIEGILDEPIE